MKVELQEWTPENAAKRVPILNNPGVYRFLAPQLPIPYPMEASLSYIDVCRREGRHDLAVVVDGEPVGSVGVHPRPDPHVAELGYYLDPSHHRQGIMTRAVGMLIARVPELMPAVTRLTAHVFDHNPASQALLRRCGFHLTNKVLMERARDGLEHRLLVFERVLRPEGEAQPRVTLEPWTPENAAARVPLLNEPRIRRYMSDSIPYPYTMEDSLEYIRLCREWGFFHRAVVVDGSVVGGVGVEVKDAPHVAELGYYLDPAWHRQGIMTRAVGMMVALVPAVLPDVRLLTAHVFEENAASRAFALRIGFTLTDRKGVERTADGAEHTVLCYERRLDTPMSPRPCKSSSTPSSPSGCSPRWHTPSRRWISPPPSPRMKATDAPFSMTPPIAGSAIARRKTTDVPSITTPTTAASATASRKTAAAPSTTMPTTAVPATASRRATDAPSTTTPITAASATASRRTAAAPSTTIPITAAPAIAKATGTATPPFSIPTTAPTSRAKSDPAGEDGIAHHDAASI